MEFCIKFSLNWTLLSFSAVCAEKHGITYRSTKIMLLLLLHHLLYAVLLSSWCCSSRFSNCTPPFSLLDLLLGIHFWMIETFFFYSFGCPLICIHNHFFEWLRHFSKFRCQVIHTHDQFFEWFFEGIFQFWVSSNDNHFLKEKKSEIFRFGVPTNVLP